MTDRIDILKTSVLKGNVRSLPSSKSLSNRALIINALLQNRGTLKNLSVARDTQLMQSLLATQDHVIDVRDAGTTMRFLTAYYGLTGQSKLLTGTDRMNERPIYPLVDALRKLGVTIDYPRKQGYPPIEIKGFTGQLTDGISIRGDVSSQFISALMMLAPTLPKGLTIQVEGKVGSIPYLVMTAELMKIFGAKVEITGAKILVLPGGYQPVTYKVELDWSAASYWFAFAALAESADILLPGVESASLQGDRVIVEIMEKLGVTTAFEPAGLRLRGPGKRVDHLRFDFSNCPDLAQTVLPVCAALKVPGEFLGLESLRIKETDRIAALQNELAKIGATLSDEPGNWKLIPGKSPAVLNKLSINTYHDHRMAMGFAPWATLTDIEIENPDVVQKSYPGFWEDMRGVGFGLS